MNEILEKQQPSLSWRDTVLVVLIKYGNIPFFSNGGISFY